MDRTKHSRPCPSGCVIGVLVVLAACGCGFKPRKVLEIGDDAGGVDAGAGVTAGRGGNGGGNGSGGKNAGAGGMAGSASGSGGKRAGAGGMAGSASGSGGKSAGGAGGSAGSAGQAGSTGGSSEVIASFAKLAETQCKKLSDCSPFGLAVAYGSQSACQARQMLLYGWQATLPDTAISVTNVDACAAAIAAQNCLAAFSSDQPQTCNLPGTRSVGAACNSRLQCASRFCTTNGYDCGVCAATPAAGATCTGDENCADGMACFDGSCLRPGKLGETCTDVAPCGSPLLCYGGQCGTAPSTVGADCDPSSGLVCDLTQGLVCAAATSTCVNATPSDTCSGAMEYCQGQKYCDRATGNCLPRPGDSGACDPNNSLCQYPALCIAAKCELPASATTCPTR